MIKDVDEQSIESLGGFKNVTEIPYVITSLVVAAAMLTLLMIALNTSPVSVLILPWCRMGRLLFARQMRTMANDRVFMASSSRCPRAARSAIG